MIEINASKVAQVIIMAREGPLVEAELRAFIDDLNEDEQAHLTAIAWVGRGAYDEDDYDEAVETAYTEATTPTADYLMGMPHLSENLEAGMEILGVDIEGEEEDLL